MTAIKALVYSGALDTMGRRGNMIDMYAERVKKNIPQCLVADYLRLEQDYIGYTFSASTFVEIPNEVLAMEHLKRFDEIPEVIIMGFVENVIESKLKSGKSVGEYYGIYEITNYRTNITGVKMWAEIYKEYGFKLVPGSWFKAVMQKNKYGWSFKRILEHAEHGIEELTERETKND